MEPHSEARVPHGMPLWGDIPASLSKPLFLLPGVLRLLSDTFYHFWPGVSIYNFVANHLHFMPRLQKFITWVPSETFEDIPKHVIDYFATECFYVA